MKKVPSMMAQTATSIILSLLLSVGLSYLLRLILSSVDGPPPNGDGRPRRPIGANINPVAVFVFMPIIVASQFGSNNIGPGGRRGLFGRR